MRAYLWMNALYYGFMILGMAYTAFEPSFRDLLNATNQKMFSSTPLLSSVYQAYHTGQLFAAMGWTFAINLLLGTFLYITVPSFFSPLIGISLGTYRAVTWGVIFSPVPFTPALAPHYLTLIIEGQAYIVAMLAAVLLRKSQQTSLQLGESRMDGYRKGLRITARLYVVIVILLAAAAVYEAVEVIAIIPLLR